MDRCAVLVDAGYLLGAAATLIVPDGIRNSVIADYRPMLADIMKWTPIPGIGPYDGYDADETLAGGEKLELAGFDVDVIFTPGHSIGHLTYSIPDETAIFSGDVLFQGSVGRVDLPGGDWPTLLESIRTLVDGHPEETTVYPGHMGITTLGAERATNPFLAELAR